MSNDIGLICFKNSDTAPLPSAIVKTVLAPYITPIDDEEWALSFPDGGGGEISPLNDSDEYIDFCVTHASGTDILEAMYEIMRQIYTVLWWTGCDDAMITADPDIAAHLPADYIKDYGMPALVRGAADILEEIDKT